MKKYYHRFDKSISEKGALFLSALVILFLVSCSTKFSKQEMVTTLPDSVYVNQGNRIVALTFDTLRSSLLEAIQLHNFDGAVAFCNEEAYPITATYADSVTIRRTALRFRNPKNKPDSLEQSVLNEMELQAQSAQSPSVKIVRSGSDGEIHFFKPIMMQAMCLNCHGAPDKQIQSSTLTRIRKFYPGDAAVDFKDGDLRGAWHVVFRK